MAEADAIVDIRGVEKSFDGVPALAGVDLVIKRGEFFSLLGASGCGKSTLLRLIAGFETPDAGAIAIDGVDMAGVPPHRRPTNMMFQSYALFPHMSVFENVAFGLRQEGVAKDERARRVGEALALVSLGDFARRRPDQLSGGQRQRVALARAIVKRPKVVLLDEPLSALDRKLREATRLELVNIQERVGITFVMVTHDQEEAMAMSSRIAVMDRGRIVQVGAPREIYEFPQSRFVADFVGAVNLFSGRLVEDEPDRAAIDSPDWGARLRIDHGVSGTVGQNLWLAVRPEKLILSPGRPEGVANSAPGVVSAVAYLGDATIHHVRLSTGAIVRVATANIDRHGVAPGPGAAVHVSFAGDAGVVLHQ